MGEHFEVKAKCKSCGGTGIYVGFGEKDGAGIVCHTCNGTGCQIIKIDWEPFHCRIKTDKVKRVFRCNPGIFIGESDDGKLRLKDFGGMPYDEWWKGLPFPSRGEMRQFVCPTWWYQNVAYSPKPNWKECVMGGSFSECKYFPEKNKCWERWDEEQKIQAKEAIKRSEKMLKQLHDNPTGGM
jgi:hypothetical protein